MMKRILYILIFTSLTFSGFSQSWSRYKYEFYYGLGASNFMGDISAPKDVNKLVWVNLKQTVGFTSNTGLRYNINDRHYLRGSLFLGQLYAKESAESDKYQYVGRKFNTFYTELSARYEIMVWKEKQKSTVYRKLGESSIKNFSLPTYLFVGLGGTLNLGNYSKVSADGKYLIEEFYTNFAPIVPLGIGFKYKLNRLTYVNLEATINLTFSDGIDNVENGWIDQYQTITFNIVRKLKQNQNGSPKFFNKGRTY